MLRTLATISASASVPNACANSHAVLFLHGLGDTNDSLERWLRRSKAGGLVSALESAGVKLVFPAATPIAYKLAGGRLMSAWFDRTGLPPTAAEHRPSIDASVTQLEGVLAQLEEREGIPPSRVVVGGFSQGGGMALQLAYRGAADTSRGACLAAVFALSSYACNDSPIWASVRESPARPKPPLYQRHGDSDGYILPAWGQATAERLRAEGVDVDFALEPNLDHSMGGDELAQLTRWLLQIVGSATTAREEDGEVEDAASPTAGEAAAEGRAGAGGGSRKLPGMEPLSNRPPL